ncbi:MAG: hypothetical protein E7449_01085 [Ruminococcaceae bacterium]|nr:hypothetical protein [Oscillospiraceae bacterium]
MERNWRLGDDLIPSDNILDSLTFDDLILSARHTSTVTPEAVRKNLKDMLEGRLEDMWFLVENNMDIIIKTALKGRM